MVEKVNVGKAVLLTICTFGLWGIFWFIALTDELNLVTHEEEGVHGVKAWVFSVLTLGIYGIYWAYRIGKKVELLKGSKNSTGIKYAILQFFLLGIVVFALAQDALNEYA